MFRDLESQLLDCWLLEIGHGLGIYIMEIDKWYKIELLIFFREPVNQYTTDYSSQKCIFSIDKNFKHVETKDRALQFHNLLSQNQ